MSKARRKNYSTDYGIITHSSSSKKKKEKKKKKKDVYLSPPLTLIL